MHSAEHRVRVLTAIIENAAATPGEVAAARAALAVHTKRCGGDEQPRLSRHASTPATAATIALVGPSRDVLLVFQDGWWTLVVDGNIAGEWRGDGEVTFERSEDYLGDIGYECRERRRAIYIEARIAGLAFDSHVRHGPVRIVIEHGLHTWLFDARYMSTDMNWDAHHTVWRSLYHESNSMTCFRFAALHLNTLFVTTSEVVGALTP